MKPYTKVTYKTDKGLTFKTIAPVSEMIAFDYMQAHYSNVEVLTMKPSKKKGYKKFVNVRSIN